MRRLVDPRAGLLCGPLLGGPLVALVALLGTARGAAAAPVMTAPLPAGHGDSVARAPGIPTTLFVNFDGAVLRSGCGNNAHRDCSTLADLFDGYVGPFAGNMFQKLAIIQATRRDLEDFGVIVVTDRPPDEVDYTMILYGDLGDQSFAGVAPYVDCGDLWPSDTAFAAGFGASNTGSTIILQEAAHTWGLEHVNAPRDNLHPFKTVGSQEFTDTCERIVSNTDLEESGGICNQIHTLFCPIGQQNSWQEMRYLFGPAIPDITPPTLEITSPEDGSFHVLPVNLPLRGMIADDRHLQIYELTIFQIDGPDGPREEIHRVSDVTLDLSLRNPPAGDYHLTIRVADEAGNLGEAAVRFTILPEGSTPPPPETADEAPENAGSCTITGGAPASSALAVLLGLWGLARRRRPRY